MSFRGAKSEASLRLYSLPRRELQALCKQYGIPANKTNVKMADALSACIPAENAKTRAWAGAGASSLGVSKTTPMKVKLERKIGLPETSLASLILNGKRKVSPVKQVAESTTLVADMNEASFPKPNTTPLKRGIKRTVSPVKQLAEKSTLVADMKEASFPMPNTTPLKRGIKRTERPLQTLQEEKVSAAAAPAAFTRAAAAALHDGKSVSSPKPRAPTPRKRTAEIAAVVTRRGGDALPPVSFSDLVSTPKKSEPQVSEIILLSTAGNTAKKIKSRLGARTSTQDEETTTLPLSRASRGKRVAFADELEQVENRLRSRERKDSSPASDHGKQPEPETETIEELENSGSREREDSNPAADQENQLEPETETIEISYAEIEFKNTPLHRELLGVRRNSPMDEEQDVVAAQREATEHREDASEISGEVGFEFRDMAVHKELFGSKSETNYQGDAHSPHDLQRAGTSDNAIDSEASDLGISNSPFTSSPGVLDYSNSALGQDHTVLSSIREDASDESDIKVEELDEHTQNHLPQGPLPDEMACDDLAESCCEKGKGVQVVGDDHSPACSLNKLQDDSILASVQEPTAVSPSADAHLRIQEEDIQQQEPDNHTVDVLEDGMIDNTLETDGRTHVSSTPVPEDRQRVHTCPTPKSAEVRRSPQELVHKEETKASPSVASADGVTASGAELVMPGPSTFKIPVTPLTKIQSSTDSPLARSVTPLTKIQSNIDSTLAKATSILEKLAAWRADAEKKMREGYWEPKFSSVVENDSPAAVFKTPIAKQAVVADKDLPSAKKARPTPKATSGGSEKGLIVCEDADIVSKGEVPSIKRIRTSDESRDSSEVSDKENQREKNMGDKNSRRLGVVGKDNKKGKKFEVLKDRSKNVSDHASVENALGTIKTGTGQIRPEDMSLRKLRAQVKEKVRQLETSKVSDQRTQRSWN